MLQQCTFDAIRSFKLEMTPEKLCMGNARDLLPFVKEVFSYKYKAEPYYTKLKFMLVKVLVVKGKIPDS